jgi:hypothetical protein
VKYNIPVIIWLPERYPMHAPLVYVTPTPNMVIKQNHSCVDPSGQVRGAAGARGTVCCLLPASYICARISALARAIVRPQNSKLL